ncbi:ROK family transcriptional regulator [Halalkalibacter lacteus]|uniref:ROK family transcriptional regulator n=1 Tax=Halalkalibacter lacteus TaxID=3090663 RepID=UPI002FCA0407
MSWNQKVVKVKNKHSILKTIIERAPLSRADISQHIGLTKGTVSTIVNELLKANLCYETGPGESSGGRRPVMLLFNERAGYSIGIDLGVNYILGVLTDLCGTIIEEKMITITKKTYEDILILLKEVIQFLRHLAPESPYGVVGIGIGVPGIVTKDGKILHAPNLGWKNISLKQDIEKDFALPVTIDNEANAGAYGEKRFGAGKDFENLIYISAGMGIGVGFMLNNELYRGAEGFAGEMGHMIIEVNGEPCSCGSRGCWELYASEKALLEQATKDLTAVQPEQTLEELITQAGANDEIKAIFKQVGEKLGIGINNIINSFNPQQIIIGNRLALAENLLLNPILQVVEDRTLKHNQSNLQITFSDLASHSSALGISAYAIENFIDTEMYTEL